jgi:hypothetical protein
MRVVRLRGISAATRVLFLSRAVSLSFSRTRACPSPPSHPLAGYHVKVYRKPVAIATVRVILLLLLLLWWFRVRFLFRYRMVSILCEKNFLDITPR